MRPLQVCSTRCCAALALALTIVALCCCTAGRARANADVPVPPPTPVLERPASVDPLDLVAGEKQHVPKPPDQPRYKPGSSTPPDKPSSSSSDDDKGSTCFDNCFTSGTPSESSEPAPAQQVVIAQTHAWSVDDRGWLRAGANGDSVTLRAASPVEGRPDTVTGRLPDGAEVVVIETYRTDTDLKLRVRPVDALGPDGWLSATQVAGRRPKAAKRAGLAPSDASGLAAPAGATPAPWSLPALVGTRLVVGGTVPFTGGFEHEYDDGGLYVEAEVLDYLSAHLVTSAGFGFRSMTGKPKLMYTTPTQWDVPAESRLELYDLSLTIGASGGPTHARYFVLAGPALFLVHERARLETFTPQMVGVGSYRSSLARYAGGGVLQMGGAYRTAKRFEFGVMMSVCAMSWEGHEDKSLATDFVHHGLYLFDFGLTFAYPTR
jgi:hypothetical protein